jgi:hypothetical protein
MRSGAKELKYIGEFKDFEIEELIQDTLPDYFNINGTGLGNWFYGQSFSDFPSEHVERVPYFVELMLELGFIPFLFYLFYLFKKNGILNKIIYLPYLLALFIVSDPGSPVVPFCLSYLIFYLNRRSFA